MAHEEQDQRHPQRLVVSIPELNELVHLARGISQLLSHGIHLIMVTAATIQSKLDAVVAEQATLQASADLAAQNNTAILTMVTNLQASLAALQQPDGSVVLAPDAAQKVSDTLDALLTGSQNVQASLDTSNTADASTLQPPAIPPVVAPVATGTATVDPTTGASTGASADPATQDPSQTTADPATGG